MVRLMRQAQSVAPTGRGAGPPIPFLRPFDSLTLRRIFDRDTGMPLLWIFVWGWGGRDGLAVRGRPPLDPSTWLRVSGPSWGWIPARGPE